MAVSLGVQFSRLSSQLCLRPQSNSVFSCIVRPTHKYTRVATAPDTKYTKVYRDLHGTITDESNAKDFVYALTEHERILLGSEIQRFEAELKGTTDVSGPTNKQLFKVFLTNALPFIGFGFLDNALMITAGEIIEKNIGILLPITTMTAAAMGNTVSDVFGVTVSHQVEKVAGKININVPPLTPEQVEMSQVKFYAGAAKVIGIFIGCTIGMFPLMFLAKD